MSDEAPAPRLRRETHPPPHPRGWASTHAAGLVTLALGVASFCVVALTTQRFWSTPDARLTVPLLSVTAASAAWALIRRERVALPLLGVGLAAAAVVLGWFLITAIVVGVTTIVILALSHAL